MSKYLVEIDKELFSILKEESKKSAKSISDIVNKKLLEIYGQKPRKEKLLFTLNLVFGLWKNRNFQVETFVRSLRRGSRVDTIGHGCSHMDTEGRRES